MSKVLLVGRELLENCCDAAKDAHAASLLKELEAILDKPAEAEGVDFGFDDRSVKVSQEAYSIFLARERHHLVALSAVTAERDRLREENERLKARPEQALTEALGERLMQSSAENYIETTFGIDGTDEDLVVTLRRSAGKTPHELRLKAEAERDQLRAEVEALRNELAGKPLVC